MATVTPETLETATPLDEPIWNKVTLEGVDWDIYDQLCKIEENDHIRMSYLDGTLTIMSPELIHDEGAGDLEILVRSVCVGLGVEIRSIRTTTLRRKIAARKGGGKDPDASFYLGDNALRMRKQQTLDLTVDPPPDLSIEVDNTRDSARSLPIYARLGVPEVWRFSLRKKTLWFGRLEGDAYVTIDRSVGLPRLTPPLVLEALDVLHQGDIGEGDWSEWVKVWAKQLPIG